MLLKTKGNFFESHDVIDKQFDLTNAARKRGSRKLSSVGVISRPPNFESIPASFYCKLIPHQVRQTGLPTQTRRLPVAIVPLGPGDPSPLLSRLRVDHVFAFILRLQA
jgi:hypothetical protein